MTTKTPKTETVATVAHADKRAAILAAWHAADGAAGVALVNCYLGTAEFGATSPEEVATARGWYAKNADGERVVTGSAKAYASAFNRADKVSQKLGIAACKDLILRAAKNADGRVREAIADALGAAMAETRGLKEVTKAQAKKVATAALAVVADKEADRKAAASARRAPRQPGTVKGGAAPAVLEALASKGTATAYKEAGLSLRLLSVALTDAPAPEGRDAAAKAALKTLRDAVEAFAVFL